MCYFFFIPYGCAKTQSQVEKDADEFCAIHSQATWKSREHYTALENMNFLNTQIKEKIKSQAFLAIFSRLENQGYTDFYAAIQPEISKLIGKPWKCPDAEQFYHLSWVKKDQDSIATQETIITIQKNSAVVFDGVTYSNSADTSYLTKLKSTLQVQTRTVLLKVPTGTTKELLNEYLKPFREMGIKHLSVVYY